MIYDTIIAQSRNPIFYTQMGVPDDLSGRYNMIVLHLAILFTSIKRHDGADARELRQHIFVKFIGEMEAMVRDFGIDDERIPHEIRNIVGLCSQQIGGYDIAAMNGQEALAAEICANFDATHESHRIDTDTLAEYVLISIGNMQKLPLASIEKGHVEFPA